MITFEQIEVLFTYKEPVIYIHKDNDHLIGDELRSLIKHHCWLPLDKLIVADGLEPIFDRAMCIMDIVEDKAVMRSSWLPDSTEKNGGWPANLPDINPEVAGVPLNKK